MQKQYPNNEIHIFQKYIPPTKSEWVVMLKSNINSKNPPRQYNPFRNTKKYFNPYNPDLTKVELNGV